MIFLTRSSGFSDNGEVHGAGIGIDTHGFNNI